MQDDSRTANSIKNIITGFTGQAVQMLLGFVSRMVFVRCLSQDYLGVNGLFTNILSMLSLAELGIGTAIVYALYKPLADKDEEKLASLMHVYSIAYRSIGIIVAVVGLCLIPFLKFFIADPPDIQESLVVIYCLYLFNTASSYFFTYKTSILNADQKNYIVVGTSYIVTVIQTVAQIIILLNTRNYLLYLLCQILFGLTYNFIISWIADKRYPYIRKKSPKPLDNTTKKGLLENIRALIIIKLSGVLVNSTDNIIISAISGLATTGINSNYTLLTNTLNSILNQIFSGITARVGNLNATEKIERKIEMFNILNLFNFWMYSWSAVTFIILAGDIVKICFGDSYVLPPSLSVIIALNYYTVGMQNTVWTYKNTMGLYKYGKFMVLVTGVLNILLSILFGRKWGLFGILFATLVSRALTNIWYDPYAVYKHGLLISPIIYLKKYLTYILIGAGILVLTWGACLLASGEGLVMFIIKLIICICIPNFILVMIFGKSKEFMYILHKVKKIITRRSS